MVEQIVCTTCTGKGRERWYDFEGSTWKPCTNCDGTGTIEVVVTDWAAYEAEVMAAAAEAFNAIADVETFLGVAPVAPLSIDHPGMTAQFFDIAIKRAHDAELAITFTGPETALVSSASNSTVRYLTTRTRCSCTGGTTHNRCLHRAYLIAHLDVFRAPVAEPIAA